jgi:hypothetical protein
MLEGRWDECERISAKVTAELRDGEAVFYLARQLSFIGAVERAEAELERAIGLGFYCLPMFLQDPWLQAVREQQRGREILQRAEGLHRRAVADFFEAGGEEVLRVTGRTPTTD